MANDANLFRSETWIPYRLANVSDVQITIYDVRGTVVRQLAAFIRARAVRRIGTVATMLVNLLRVASISILTAGDFTATRKLLLRK